MQLPELAPFANAAQRIEANSWLYPEDRAFLTAMLARMRAAYKALEFTLPPGVIHGDANVGNAHGRQPQGLAALLAKQAVRRFIQGRPQVLAS